MKTPKTCVIRARVTAQTKADAQLIAAKFQMDESDVLRIALEHFKKKIRLAA